MKLKKSTTRILLTVAATVAVTSSINVLAQNAYTPGNLIVDRSGIGGANTLSANGTEIFLDQYTTAGVFVSSNSVPTNGPSSIVDGGISSVEGWLTVNPNGKNVVLVGYNVPFGFSGPGAASAASAPRAVGTMDFNGNFNYVTSTITSFSAVTFRAATTDGGTNYWAAAGGTGIAYMGTAATNLLVVPPNSSNNRFIQVVGGNLFYSSGSGTPGIYEITGTPITAGSTPTPVRVLGEPGSPFNFVFDPLMDTCYIADADTFASYSTVGQGGIEKFTWNGSAWVYQYSIAPPPNDNASIFSIAVDWTTMPPTIYGITTNLFKVQDTGTNAVSVALATNAVNERFASVVIVPNNNPTPVAPVITSISPSGLVTNNGGGTVTFRLNGTTGSPIASNTWYKISGGVTNVIAGANMTSLTLTNLTPANQASYFAVLTNASGSVTSSVISLTVIATPSITGISPISVSANAGQKVTFTITSSPGFPPASNLWYRVIGTTTNLISNGPQSSGSVAFGATTGSLTLSNVLGADSASYFAVLTNIFGSATSAVATLTVNNDPNIQVQPRDSYGLIDGSVEFSVTGFGTSPNYQWYFADASGNIIAPVPAGHDFGDQAVVSGVNSSLLTISDVQYADLTNFVVIISNVYGSQTSSVASLLEVTNIFFVEDMTPYFESQPPVTPIALWDFNGPEFTNTAINPNCIAEPSPYIGVGTTLPVGSCNDPGTSPFSGSVDPADGAQFDILIPIRGDHLPNFSWGTDNYPASGSNKMNGVQFDVSTVGAKNILLAYDSRVSATASDYERVQYTTNGTDWIDYPSSSTFGGVGTTYISYTNDFSGFPNVANNPNFGVRIVTEAQYTATYGISGGANTNAYLGTANTYGTAGTVTYDLVGIYGDAITNNNIAPVISPFMNTNTIDNAPITIPFTVSGDTTADHFGFSALSLNISTVNPGFSFTKSPSGNCTLTITPNIIQQPVAAAPILVSVTDTNGDVSKAWFLLTLTSANLPPTNSLTQLTGTNTIANTTLTIPFIVGSQSNSVSQFSYSSGSGNSTVVPPSNISFTGQGTANPSVIITPGSNELGVATVSVTVDDNNISEAKSTTANIPFMVRPNTNVVFVDYFNYDQSGFLDQIGGFWQHLTGNFHTMALNSSPTGGYVVVDTANATENMEVPLLGAPYSTNAAAAVNTLYYSMSINLNNPNDMPNSNGTYFAALNDGLPAATADVEALLLIATNGVAPEDFGDYQVGIANDVGATVSSPTTVMFPQDLVPGINYNVVVGLNLSNGVSTVWVNPSSQSSPSVTAPVNAATVVYNISDFELRQSGNESGDIAGAIYVSYLKVGTTFDSVFPTLHVQPSGNSVIVNWSDPTLGIQSTTNLLLPFTDIPSASPPYTNSTATNSAVFFRFGR